MGGDSIDCPICLTLSPPIFETANVGQIHYLDSRFYVTCDECGLKVITTKYREMMADAAVEILTRKTEEE